MGQRKVIGLSSFSEDELRMLDGVGGVFEEAPKAPVMFLFPEIADLGFGLDGTSRRVGGRGGMVLAREERQVKVGFADAVTEEAEEEQGDATSIGTLFGLRGSWENGMSFLLQGPSHGRWNRDISTVLRFFAAPSLLSVSLGARNALRTFPLMNMFLVGLSRGLGH